MVPSASTMSSWLMPMPLSSNDDLALVGIGRDGDAQLGVVAEQGRVGDRLVAQPLAGVGGVGDQFAHEHVFVGIDRVHHHVQQLGDVGLERAALGLAVGFALGPGAPVGLGLVEIGCGRIGHGRIRHGRQFPWRFKRSGDGEESRQGQGRKAARGPFEHLRPRTAGSAAGRRSRRAQGHVVLKVTSRSSQMNAARPREMARGRSGGRVRRPPHTAGGITPGVERGSPAARPARPRYRSRPPSSVPSRRPPAPDRWSRPPAGH